MTRSTYRRAAALLAGAAVAAGLLSGCSAGQIAETALKEPSVPGGNAQVRVRNPDGGSGTVAVRDALVVYRDSKGYRTGGEAPLQLVIVNDTPRALTVRVNSPNPAGDDEHIVPVRAVELAGASAAPSPSGSGPGGESPSARPSASAEPRPPAARPAIIEIPAGSLVALNPTAGTYLKVVGLGAALTPGRAVNLSLDFGEGIPPLSVVAPVAPPLSPPMRATADVEEPGEGGH